MTGSVLLDVQDLHGWYGESHVLHGVSFDLKQGETVALMGRNGVGKTTVLRAIVGLLKKRQGRIALGESDLLNVPIHHVARLGVGYVPEERGIFTSLSVLENLLLPPSVSKSGMSVEELFDVFPNLKERRDSLGGGLSGGEQQMLAIARVLRMGATIILLDEPTEGLAPVIVQRIGEVLATLKTRGISLLLVEQNFRFVHGLADRFYFMADGRVIESYERSQVAGNTTRIHELLGV